MNNEIIAHVHSEVSKANLGKLAEVFLGSYGFTYNFTDPSSFEPIKHVDDAWNHIERMATLDSGEYRDEFRECLEVLAHIVIQHEKLQGIEISQQLEPAPCYETELRQAYERNGVAWPS